MVSKASSRVLSMRLSSAQMDRLQRIARRLGHSASQTGALLVEEALRREEFAYVDFRQSPAGRQAYVTGSSLAVWEVILVARSYGLDLTKTSAHLRWPEFRTQAALAYAKAYPDEIELALEDNLSYNFSAIKRLLPQTELFVAESSRSSSYDTKKPETSKPRRKRRGSR